MISFAQYLWGSEFVNAHDRKKMAGTGVCWHNVGTLDGLQYIVYELANTGYRIFVR